MEEGEAIQADNEAGTPGGAGGESRTVLIVDDEEAMCDSCAQVLRREGLKVYWAQNGRDALGLVGEHSPDVVFVDLKMPGMSGMEFLAKAREMDRNLVAVVITGYATLSSAVEAMKGGAYDFLPKPFKADELKIVARRAVEKRVLSLAAASAEREKKRMRDNFVAMVSHQLKSPLASLKECLDAATSSFTGEIPEACNDLVERASRRSGNLLQLMDDWLTLSRMESPALLANAKAVKIEEVVKSAVAAARESLQWHDVEVEIKVAGTGARVVGDEEALRQLFVNLADNAIRYTPDGGRATVEVNFDAAGATVTVSDTGCGIAASELGLVFEPFYRGNQADRTEGTGLGLAISKQIAEAHGGSISVSSKKGEGTTFKVILPHRGAG